MSDKNQENNIAQYTNQREMISFSEVDENGVFREAYGYIVPRKKDASDDYLEKKIKEISEKLKRL